MHVHCSFHLIHSHYSVAAEGTFPLPIHLSIYLSIYLFIYRSVCLSVCLSLLQKEKVRGCACSLALPAIKHFGTQMWIPVAVVQDGEGLRFHVPHLHTDHRCLILQLQEKNVPIHIRQTSTHPPVRGPLLQNIAAQHNSFYSLSGTSSVSPAAQSEAVGTHQTKLQRDPQEILTCRPTDDELFQLKNGLLGFRKRRLTSFSYRVDNAY